MDALFGIATLVFLAAIGLFVYFFPLEIAMMRRIEQQSYKRVMMVNAFAGWTGVGWVLALIMACACPSTSVDPTENLWVKPNNQVKLPQFNPQNGKLIARHCGQCGVQLPGGSKFCTECGATVVQALAFERGATPTSPSSC